MMCSSSRHARQGDTGARIVHLKARHGTKSRKRRKIMIFRFVKEAI